MNFLILTVGAVAVLALISPFFKGLLIGAKALGVQFLSKTEFGAKLVLNSEHEKKRKVARATEISYENALTRKLSVESSIESLEKEIALSSKACQKFADADDKVNLRLESIVLNGLRTKLDSAKEDLTVCIENEGTTCNEKNEADVDLTSFEVEKDIILDKIRRNKEVGNLYTSLNDSSKNNVNADVIKDIVKNSELEESKVKAKKQIYETSVKGANRSQSSAQREVEVENTMNEFLKRKEEN